LKKRIRKKNNNNNNNNNNNKKVQRTRNIREDLLRREVLEPVVPRRQVRRQTEPLIAAEVGHHQTTLLDAKRVDQQLVAPIYGLFEEIVPEGPVA
jgi:hypothetical protein